MKTNKEEIEKAWENMFGNPIDDLEEIMTDMFGEGGAEEVLEHYKS